MIELINIQKDYKIGNEKVEILKNVNLTIQKGEFISIIGASGSGKSTLMNIIGFLDTPSTGEYLFEGQETSHFTDQELSQIRSRNIGFVFQQFNLLKRSNALSNVCLPLIYQGIKEKERIRIAREMLARVGMTDRERHKPSELSGGQQQRVAIARALAGKPDLILADEPTGALDSKTTDEIMALFQTLHEEYNITIIIITHNPDIAGQCKRIKRMHEGTLIDN